MNTRYHAHKACPHLLSQLQGYSRPRRPDGTARAWLPTAHNPCHWPTCQTRTVVANQRQIIMNLNMLCRHVFVIRCGRGVPFVDATLTRNQIWTPSTTLWYVCFQKDTSIIQVKALWTWKQRNYPHLCVRFLLLLCVCFFFFFNFHFFLSVVISGLLLLLLFRLSHSRSYKPQLTSTTHPHSSSSHSSRSTTHLRPNQQLTRSVWSGRLTEAPHVGLPEVASASCGAGATVGAHRRSQTAVPLVDDIAYGQYL